MGGEISLSLLGLSAGSGAFSAAGSFDVTFWESASGREEGTDPGFVPAGCVSPSARTECCVVTAFCLSPSLSRSHALPGVLHFLPAVLTRSVSAWPEPPCWRCRVAQARQCSEERPSKFLVPCKAWLSFKDSFIRSDRRKHSSFLTGCPCTSGAGTSPCGDCSKKSRGAGTEPLLLEELNLEGQLSIFWGTNLSKLDLGKKIYVSTKLSTNLGPVHAVPKAVPGAVQQVPQLTQATACLPKAAAFLKGSTSSQEGRKQLWRCHGQTGKLVCLFCWLLPWDWLWPVSQECLLLSH